jgi:hypothetical protein
MTVTPGPDAPLPMTFRETVERTVQKFVRDLVVNLVMVSPMLLGDGEFSAALILPTIGLAFYRTFRDVFPGIVRRAG